MNHYVIHIDRHIERAEFIKNSLGDKIKWQFVKAVDAENLVDYKTNKKPVVKPLITMGYFPYINKYALESSLDVRLKRFYNPLPDGSSPLPAPDDPGLDYVMHTLQEPIILKDVVTNKIYNYIPFTHFYGNHKPYLTSQMLTLISNGLSFKETLRYHYENNEEDYCVILEDDVYINDVEYLKTVYNQLQKMDFDVCILCESPKKEPRPKFRQINENIYEINPHLICGTGACMFTRSFYNKLKYLDFISFAADCLISVCQENYGCKILCSDQPVFKLGEVSKQSTISP